MTSTLGKVQAEEPGSLAPPLSDPETELTAATPSKRRTLLQRGVEVVVSLVCLFLALRAANPADLLDKLRQAQLIWILAYVALMLVVLALKTWRWQLLFYPDYRLPFKSLFSILAVGYMVSNVLPGRAGELARVALVPAEHPVSAARTISTIVVERLLDLLSVLLILTCLLPFVRLPEGMVRSAQALGLVALLGGAALILTSYWKTRLLGLAHAALSHVRLLDRPAVYSGLEHLLDGFAMLRSPSGLVVMVLALLSWAGIIAMAWTAAVAFHITVAVTAIVFAVVLTSLSMLLPSTPGYVGVFQLAAKMALVPLGVAASTAEIYGIAWWGVNYLTLTAIGVVAMWVHGISFSQVMRWRKRKA